MRRFLLWSLYGPLQSWGQHAVGEVRRSDAVPTKSAVLGMLAAALGMDRNDQARHQQLHSSLGFGVMVLRGGHLERDFHTVQMPKHQRKVQHHTRKAELRDPNVLNTLISRRDYRGDAFHLVALWPQSPEVSLDHLAAALKQPHYQLSLGRRCCVPALPMDPQSIQAETLREAFLAYKHRQPAQALLPTTGTSCQAVWDSMENAGIEPIQQITRRDAVGHRAVWTFQNRMEWQGVLAFEATYSNEEDVHVSIETDSQP